MGMGEPLLNWPAVATALTLLNDPDALGIGARHITVSTVGILPIARGAGEAPRAVPPGRVVACADQRPAPDHHADREAVPAAGVLEALDAFRRRVTFEYVLIAGVNDRDEDLVELARIAKAAGAMVNLLPLHPGGAPGLTPAPPRRLASFAAGLRRRGVEAVARRSRGLDIAAACGQLRALRRRRGRRSPARAAR